MHGRCDAVYRWLCERHEYKDLMLQGLEQTPHCAYAGWMSSAALSGFTRHTPSGTARTVRQDIAVRTALGSTPSLQAVLCPRPA
jgi:hypothetical protein